MVRKSFSALLFSLITLAGIGCWDFGYEESQYVSPFDETVLVAPDLMPFLFSAHDFHWSFDSLTQGRLESSEARWQSHFHHQYSLNDLQPLVNDWTEDEFQRAFLSKEDTFNNSFLTDLRRGKHPVERKYLELAHQSSKLKERDDWANFFSWWDISYKIETAEDDAKTSSIIEKDTLATKINLPFDSVNGANEGINWLALEQEKKKNDEAARLQDSLITSRTSAREKLIHQFENLLTKTKNVELMERIQYQILVLNFYQPMGGKFETVFQKAYPQPKPQSIFYWMAWDHFAGTPNREMQDDNALDWVRIFLHAPTLRKGAIASFPEQDDDSWEGLLNCAKNTEEKVGLWLILAYQQPEITAYAYEKAFEISPNSPLTDLLMVREIQQLESRFHLQENRLETFPYTPAYTYEYQGTEVKQQIKLEAIRWKQLHKKHSNVSETQQLGLAYLLHLAGNEEKALEALQNFHPKNENLLRSKKVFQILIKQQLSYRDGWNEGQDAQTVKDLEWLSQFPGFERISNKKGWNLTDWERPDGKSDLPYDGRIYESNETYPYAAMRDGLRMYLYEYMRHRSEEEDPFFTPSATKSLAMWFLSPLFNVYEYPENWDPAGILNLIQNPENQSKTDQWFFNHLPKTVEQTTTIYQNGEWRDSSYTLPINTDFWNEIAGELALQKRDYVAANLHFQNIQKPKLFPRLNLSHNPFQLHGFDATELAKTWFNFPTIATKTDLASTLNTLFAAAEDDELKQKTAMAHWLLGILEFNISYAGNSWEASRFAWSYNDPDAFQTENYWRPGNLPNENYFDITHPNKEIMKAYDFFQRNKKMNELAAGCAISLLQLNVDGIPTPWYYSQNSGINQPSKILIDLLQNRFYKTKTFQTFEKNCPEYEVYALSNWN
jgi:hypothetical protein